MAVKVAINGFGRIGRNILRAIIESGRTDIEVIAINDLGPVETNAHLLKYDSVHGRFPGTVKVTGNELDLGRGPIRVMSTYNPEELDWEGVDIVLECTGKFNDRDKAAVHLTRGAKRVLVSAPAKRADLALLIQALVLRERVDQKYRFENLIGESPGMLSCFKTVRQVAPASASRSRSRTARSGFAAASKAARALCAMGRTNPCELKPGRRPGAAPRPGAAGLVGDRGPAAPRFCRR